jgi:hypothetical protein
VAIVPTAGEGADGLKEVVHRGVGSAADGLLRDDAEGDLDEVEPGVGMTCRLRSGAWWVRAWPMQRRSALGQVAVETADVSGLGLPLEVGGECERLDMIRLDAPFTPDPGDGGEGDAKLFAQQAGRPVVST